MRRTVWRMGNRKTTGNRRGCPPYRDDRQVPDATVPNMTSLSRMQACVAGQRVNGHHGRRAWHLSADCFAIACRTTGDRAFRLLDVLDDFKREGLGVDVDSSLPAERVIRSLDPIVVQIVSQRRPGRWAKSSAAPKPRKPASCWKITFCPTISKPGSKPSSTTTFTRATMRA